MIVQHLPFEGAFILNLRAFSDERGYFKEVYSEARYSEVGITERFVQDNISYSRHGVLRGLHADPRMSKLVEVVRGEVFDIIVDLRPSSPTYLMWQGIYLRENEHLQLYIPPNFLHGFLVLSDDVSLHYKQSAMYDPTQEFGVAWNDPDIGIEWPLEPNELPILSPKDAANPTLRERGLL